MKIFTCEQGSPAWHRLRRGRPTASRFNKILTPVTRKPSASQHDYICELIAEQLQLEGLSDPIDPSAPTFAMRRGSHVEDEARRWHEMEREAEVVRVGFCLDDQGRFGCSPDGLIGEDGGLELKCPLGKTQAAYLLDGGGLPAEYLCQVHGSLIVTGRAWWDFLSYCPGLPPILVRVTPDDFTDTLREALEAFWGRYQGAKEVIEKLGATFEPLAMG